MGKSYRQLDNQILKGAVDHLMYELEMLKETSSTLSKQPELPWNVRNSLVESFVIHARGLIMFLYYLPTKDDDVMACDYFEEGVWEKNRGPITSILETALTRANKEVAHITTFRLGKKLVEKHWNHTIITKEILIIFRVFFDQGSDSLMPGDYIEWFRALDKSITQRDLFNNGLKDASERST